MISVDEAVDKFVKTQDDRIYMFTKPLEVRFNATTTPAQKAALDLFVRQAVRKMVVDIERENHRMSGIPVFEGELPSA